MDKSEAITSGPCTEKVSKKAFIVATIGRHNGT